MPRSSHPPQARQWFFLLCALSAALLLLRPAPAMEAVREALRLCSETIVPSLFPFLVFSALLTALLPTAALDRALSPLMRPIFRLSGDCGAVLALGFAGGYPVGVRTTAALYRQGTLRRSEAQRLLAFCNNSGPGFLLGVVGSYIVAVIATVCGAQLPDANGVMQPLVNFASVGEAHLIGLQKFIIAKFDVSAVLVMAPIAIAAMMEHIGDISAISSTTGNNFIADPGLHRTLTGDGLATAFAGMFGGPANTTYGENTGVLALSKVYDPRVVRLAAVYAIILSFSPKFDALVNSIPTAIVGGVSFILYGMISAVGVRNVVENRVDLTKSRNLIIAAVIFVCGLGFSATGGITFTVGSASITLTGLAIAALAGVILNAVLPGNDYRFGTDPVGDKSADLGSY